MPGRSWESGMIGSPASAVPGAMPARMAAPTAAARWRARMGGATLAPESWCDADMPTKVQVQAWLDAYVAACRSYERDVFSNLSQLTFAPDGRCSRFVEW